MEKMRTHWTEGRRLQGGGSGATWLNPTPLLVPRHCLTCQTISCPDVWDYVSISDPSRDERRMSCGYRSGGGGHIRNFTIWGVIYAKHQMLPQYCVRGQSSVSLGDFIWDLFVHSNTIPATTIRVGGFHTCVKTTTELITCSQEIRLEKKDWNMLISKKNFKHIIRV